MSTVGEMSGTTAVVTGSNTGIGRAAAAEFARRGATVLLACRSETRTAPVLEEMRASTGNDRIEFLPLDLGDFDSIRTAASALMDSGRPLHVLVNNAGVAGQRGTTASGFEMTFGVNHLGHFLFTNLLLDRLRESSPARIVNVSSGNHFLAPGIDFEAVRGPTRTFLGLKEYNVSKLANVLFTLSLASMLEESGVSVYAVNPGPVATDVWRRMPKALYEVFRVVRRLKSATDGAAPTVHAATAAGIESLSGTYFDEDLRPKPVSRHATAELSGELWRRSAEWVGIT